MGIKNERLSQLCKWKQKNLPVNDWLLGLGDQLFKTELKTVPYKEIFLYYRFLNE